MERRYISVSQLAVCLLPVELETAVAVVDRFDVFSMRARVLSCSWGLCVELGGGVSRC